MQLVIAENGRPVQKGVDDNVFVYVKIADAAGNVVPEAANTVTLKLQGAALLESPATVNAEAGIATFIVRTHQASSLRITAIAAGLPSISKVVF
jgi:beta-galactosidase